MVFTKEQLLRLKGIGLIQEEIRIKGINSIGDEFDTVGRIEKVGNKVKINENGLSLEFGKRKLLYDFESTGISCPFYNSVKDPEKCELLIFEIQDKTGQVIYQNYNKHSLFHNAQIAKTLIEAQKTYYKIEKYDPVTAALNCKVGNPVIFRDSDRIVGVLLRLCGVNSEGKVVCEIANKNAFMKFSIKEDCILQTEHPDGRLELLARNRSDDTKDIFSERRYKIRKMTESEN